MKEKTLRMDALKGELRMAKQDLMKVARKRKKLIRFCPCCCAYALFCRSWVYARRWPHSSVISTYWNIAMECSHWQIDAESAHDAFVCQRDV